MSIRRVNLMDKTVSTFCDITILHLNFGEYINISHIYICDFYTGAVSTASGKWDLSVKVAIVSVSSVSNLFSQ